jgi:antitoxin VapB
MPLRIDNPQIEALVRELAKNTGKSVDESVAAAIREKYHRVRRTGPGGDLVRELNEIALRCAALPDRDTRSLEEILGYDEKGLPS